MEKTKESPQDMIKLLRPEFADNRTRLYAITCKNMLDEFALNRYLLQLVQAFKCEIHHNSFLTRFVIYGSLHIPWLVGHYFFWMLKSEYHQIEWEEKEIFFTFDYLIDHYSKQTIFVLITIVLFVLLVDISIKMTDKRVNVICTCKLLCFFFVNFLNLRDFCVFDFLCLVFFFFAIKCGRRRFWFFNSLSIFCMLVFL